MVKLGRFIIYSETIQYETVLNINIATLTDICTVVEQRTHGSELHSQVK